MVSGVGMGRWCREVARGERQYLGWSMTSVTLVDLEVIDSKWRFGAEVTISKRKSRF